MLFDAQKFRKLEKSSVKNTVATYWQSHKVLQQDLPCNNLLSYSSLVHNEKLSSNSAANGPCQCVNSQLYKGWLEYTQYTKHLSKLLTRILAKSATKMLYSVRLDAQPGPVSLRIEYMYIQWYNFHKDVRDNQTIFCLTWNIKHLQLLSLTHYPKLFLKLLIEGILLPLQIACSRA